MASFFRRPTIRAAAFTAAGAGVAYQGYRHFNPTSGLFGVAHAESIPSDARSALKKMEWKGFTELKLESAEMYNHNVKRLTFALPDDQSITAIAPISKQSKQSAMQSVSSKSLASILTHSTYTRRCLDSCIQTIHSHFSQW